MFYRARFALAKAIGYAICEPQLRLGRRRHDNYCDECGEYCSPYMADKLEFPLDRNEIDDPTATTKWEKLWAMFNAEYVRVCLECSTDLKSGQPSDSENSTGTRGDNR